MAMTTNNDWILRTGTGKTPKDQTGMVMAWARDRTSGEPVYVLELDASRTGAQCGCECPSCELPLTAVNAAKAEFIRRPHFRHPDGAQSSECTFLAARVAALELLKMQGFLQLPGRTVSAQQIGLSGAQHNAIAVHVGERVRIREFDFKDRVSAILTLEDGRILHIQLIGTGVKTDAVGCPVPMIYLDLLDHEMASMSRDELVGRITLKPENACWVTHWNDDELKRQAEHDARLLADSFMDLAPDDFVLVTEDAKFRRETILHLEVKKILAEHKKVWVPELSAKATGVTNGGKQITRTWDHPSELISLLDVQLEARHGRVIPDLIAKVSTQSGDLMMVEVTVSNQITVERLERIKAENLPTLEINLSASIGLISRNELAQWVIFGLETKRWVHHPRLNEQQSTLEVLVDVEVKNIDRIEIEDLEFRESVLTTPIEHIARDFLESVIATAKFEREDIRTDEVKYMVADGEAAIFSMSEKLAIHGYRGANNSELTGGRQGIISRIQSIKTGVGVGYKLNSTMDVMNAIKQSMVPNRSNHTIYLIAEKAFRTANSPVQPPWFTYWVEEIKTSISQQEDMYLRDGLYDPLLSLLFPEMSAGLANGYGRRDHFHASKQTAQKIFSDAIKGVRDFYLDGAFRPYAPRINFDDVLIEAKSIKQDGFEKWFLIWSDRYKLNGELHPIARLLDAAGYRDALTHWHSAKPIARYLTQSSGFTRSTALPKKDSVNLYALEKGRDRPRT